MARPERQFVAMLAVAVALVLVGGIVTAAVKDNGTSQSASHPASPIPTLPGGSPSASANPNVTPGSPSSPPTQPTPAGPSTPTGPSGPRAPTGPGGTGAGPQMPNTGLPIGVPIAAVTLVGCSLALGRHSRS